MLKRIKKTWNDHINKMDVKYEKRTGKKRQTQDEIKKSMDKIQAKNINIEIVLNKHKLDFSAFTPEIIKEVAPFKKGVYKIGKRKYYLLAIHEEEAYDMSKGKVVTGAIIGGVLTGGVGALIGGAIGSKKSKTPTYILELADYETKEVIAIKINIKKQHVNKFHKLKMANRTEIEVEDLSTKKNIIHTLNSK